MSRGRREAVLWVGVYLVATVAPLAVVMLIETPPGRGFWTEFSAALGFVGLSMITLQFALTSRLRRISLPYGMDIVLQFHRQISLVAGALLIGHLVVLFATQPETIGLLNVLEAPWRARFAVISMVALIVLVVTSLFRIRLGLPYELWRFVHGTLAVVGVGFGLAHVIGVGHFLELPWKQALWIGLTALAVGALFWIRIVKPILQLHEPWELERVVGQRGASWSLSLRPVGHQGFRFEPGQFAWLTLYTTPLQIREHPFSFSSSAEDTERVEFTVKELGDFTSEVKDLPEGTRAYVDGPHGAFTPERHPAPGYTFIAGGVGITPIMSILRTFADRRDQRPLQLVYSSGSWDEVTFREEIDSLRERLNLDVVHVLRDAPEDWKGETGYVDRDLLDRVLPPDRLSRFHFICGPPVLMESVEDALLDLGVPLENTMMERFNLV